MPLMEITIHLEPAEGVELTNEQIEVMGRDACAKILAEYGANAAGMRYSTDPGLLAGVRFRHHEWPSIRYPGEGRQWAITEDERTEYEEEYDDEFDDD